jgi:hypothetical protein
MNDQTREAVRDVALVLENDRRFHDEYRSLEGTARGFRDLIYECAKRLGERTFTADEREQLRRYFHTTWGLPAPTKSDKFESNPTIDLFDDGRVTANDVKNPESQSEIKEPAMNATHIEVTTKTFVNGKDIATMSDSEIYDLIASEEVKIKELEKIENKPKRLQLEIERRGQGIVDLVKYLDSKAD